MTAAEQIPSTKLERGNKATIDAFFFNPEYLAAMAEKYGPAFRNADPFPHVSIDDFVPQWVIDGVLTEFPDPNARINFYEEPNESRKGKLASTKVSQLGPFTRHIMNEFNSSEFVGFLENLTGIDHLIPDPHLMGGGTHQTKKGGFLKIHADFNWDPRLKLDRRLNLIFFLNHDWKPEYGGELELWNKEMTAKVKGYAPKAGRIVVFYTADDSHHGHPDPLTCPENVTRKSLALYYYSNGRPKEEQSIPHTTKYKRRPGENFQRRSALGSKRILERFIPPIAHDILEYAKIRTRNRKNGGGEGEK